MLVLMVLVLMEVTSVGSAMMEVMVASSAGWHTRRPGRQRTAYKHLHPNPNSNQCPYQGQRIGRLPCCMYHIPPSR